MENSFYRQTNDNIEKLSRQAHVIVMYIQVPFFIISIVMISTYTYITTDYSNESFLLIYPAT